MNWLFLQAIPVLLPTLLKNPSLKNKQYYTGMKKKTYLSQLLRFCHQFNRSLLLFLRKIRSIPLLLRLLHSLLRHDPSPPDPFRSILFPCVVDQELVVMVHPLGLSLLLAICACRCLKTHPFSLIHPHAREQFNRLHSLCPQAPLQRMQQLRPPHTTCHIPQIVTPLTTRPRPFPCKPQPHAKCFPCKPHPHAKCLPCKPHHRAKRLSCNHSCSVTHTTTCKLTCKPTCTLLPHVAT